LGLMLALGIAIVPTQAADPSRLNGYQMPSLGTMTEAASLEAVEREKIRAAIASQLAAFQHDDAHEAFSYASPGIQQQFNNAGNFLAMVMKSYRPVYRPIEVEFGDLRLLQGGPAQIMHFVGPDGVPVTAIYLMEIQPDGNWRIDGVYLIRPPEVGT